MHRSSTDHLRSHWTGGFTRGMPAVASKWRPQPVHFFRCPLSASVVTSAPSVMAPQVLAERDIARGEELTITYGATKKSWEMMLSYGFVPDGGNAADRAELSWGRTPPISRASEKPLHREAWCPGMGLLSRGPYVAIPNFHEALRVVTLSSFPRSHFPLDLVVTFPPTFLLSCRHTLFMPSSCHTRLRPYNPPQSRVSCFAGLFEAVLQARYCGSLSTSRVAAAAGSLPSSDVAISDCDEQSAAEGLLRVVLGLPDWL